MGERRCRTSRILGILRFRLAASVVVMRKWALATYAALRFKGKVAQKELKMSSGTSSMVTSVSMMGNISSNGGTAFKKEC